MPSIRFRKALSGVLLFLLAATPMAGPAFAQEPAAKPAAAVPGVKGDMLFWIQDAESKLIELAEAIPADKYSWKPAEGVRTIAQVLMHAATANLGIPTFIGVKPPEGFDFRTYETSTTDKAEVIKRLKASFEHTRNAVLNIKDADMDNPVDLFGNKTTVRGTAMLFVTHNHEHLGQMIAYARSVGVTPPWTVREQAAMKEGGK
ncbi:MAG TPA: DinB family protein [Candidatus Eisenbacteria bacterium]